MREEIDITDQGRRLELTVGDVLRVRLPENPTTGYRWKPQDKLPGQIAVVLDEYELSTGLAPGASATRVLDFDCTTSGVFVLTLVRVREWESGASPEATFVVHGVVR